MMNLVNKSNMRKISDLWQRNIYLVNFDIVLSWWCWWLVSNITFFDSLTFIFRQFQWFFDNIQRIFIIIRYNSPIPSPPTLLLFTNFGARLIIIDLYVKKEWSILPLLCKALSNSSIPLPVLHHLSFLLDDVFFDGYQYFGFHNFRLLKSGVLPNWQKYY